MYSFSLFGDDPGDLLHSLVLLRFGGKNSEGREDDDADGMDPSFPFAAWTGREWCQKLRLRGPPADTDDNDRSISDGGPLLGEFGGSRFEGLCCSPDLGIIPRGGR